MRFARCILPPVVLATLILVACAKPPATDERPRPDEPFLLTDVRLIPMDAERVIGDGAVLVRGGVIAWAGPAREAPDPGDARVVDGGGAFVLPGLIDMHVHLGDPDELDLYLLRGVTTVANLSGRPEHLELRERVRSGAFRGPTIYTAGPTIDGDPPRNPRFVAAGDAERAAEIVAEQHAAGYDFVKIYDLIERDAYGGAVEAARERGLAVVGHIPKAIGLEGILDGHDLIAHAEEYFYTFFADSDDRSRLAEAALLTAEAGVAVCPNTGFIHSIIEQAEDLDAVLARPQVRYLPPASLASWLPEANRYLGRPPEWLARNKRMYPFLLELTKALSDAGVTLVAGTDAAVPGAVPGFSLAREIGDLARAGLTSWQALRTATADPGAWIGEHTGDQAPPGVVAAGRRADLLLLDADPLADLGALDAVRAVIARGRWIERAELAADVEQRAAAYAGERAPYERFKQLVEQRDFEAAEALAAEGDAGMLGESTVNRLGYYYLYRREDPQTAIALFALNTRVYPGSSNVWDSLGEGYMVAGERERAIANYRRSLELDPDNANAVQMLERLANEGS